MTNEWRPLGPRSFIDRRMRLTRDSGLVRQNVRAYHAVIVRKGDNGKPEYANCLHAHNKPSSARKCAVKEANKRNKLHGKDK